MFRPLDPLLHSELRLAVMSLLVSVVTTEALKKILAKEGLSDDSELCRRIADGIRAHK